MLMLFFVVFGPALVKWMPKRQNKCCSVCRHSYEVAHKHQKTLERKIERRNHAVAQQCESPYNVGLTQSMLTILKSEVLSRCTTQTLSPYDYEVFGSLKKFLEGKRFSTDEKVKKSGQGVDVTSLERNFLNVGRNVFDRDSDYVEH